MEENDSELQKKKIEDKAYMQKFGCKERSQVEKDWKHKRDCIYDKVY